MLYISEHSANALAILSMVAFVVFVVIPIYLLLYISRHPLPRLYTQEELLLVIEYSRINYAKEITIEEINEYLKEKLCHH